MVLILINLLLPLAACDDNSNEDETKNPSPKTETSQGVQEQNDAILKQSEETHPHDGNKAPPLQDTAVLKDSGPEVTSALPPDIDKDADGFIDQALPNHPEFPVDNCPEFYNPDQEDESHNGIGDACE